MDIEEIIPAIHKILVNGILLKVFECLRQTCITIFTLCTYMNSKQSCDLFSGILSVPIGPSFLSFSVSLKAFQQQKQKRLLQIELKRFEREKKNQVLPKFRTTHRLCKSVTYILFC